MIAYHGYHLLTCAETHINVVAVIICQLNQVFVRGNQRCVDWQFPPLSRVLGRGGNRIILESLSTFSFPRALSSWQAEEKAASAQLRRSAIAVILICIVVSWQLISLAVVSWCLMIP